MKPPKYKDIWAKSFGTEVRRLATTTETFFCKKKYIIPNKRKADKTYARIVCTYPKGKKNKYRMGIKMGGNLLNYPGDCGTPTADLITVILLLNSVISTPNAKFTTST